MEKGRVQAGIKDLGRFNTGFVESQEEMFSLNGLWARIATETEGWVYGCLTKRGF